MALQTRNSTHNKYDPRDCNREGEAKRRYRAVERRYLGALKKAQNWLDEKERQRLAAEERGR